MNAFLDRKPTVRFSAGHFCFTSYRRLFAARPLLRGNILLPSLRNIQPKRVIEVINPRVVYLLIQTERIIEKYYTECIYLCTKCPIPFIRDGRRLVKVEK